MILLTKFEISVLAKDGIECVTDTYTVIGLMKWLYEHSYVIYHKEGDNSQCSYIWTTKDKLSVIRADFNRHVAGRFIRKFVMSTKAISTDTGGKKIMRNKRVIQILGKSIKDIAEAAFTIAPDGEVFKFECKNKKYVIEGYIDHNGRSPLLNVAIIHINTELDPGEYGWNGYRNKYDIALFEIKNYMTPQYKSKHWGKHIVEVVPKTGLQSAPVM